MSSCLRDVCSASSRTRGLLRHDTMSHSTSEVVHDNKRLFVYNTAIGSLIESVILVYSQQMSGFKRVLSAAISEDPETSAANLRQLSRDDYAVWVLEVSLFNHMPQLPSIAENGGINERFSTPFPVCVCS